MWTLRYMRVCLTGAGLAGGWRDEQREELRQRDKMTYLVCVPQVFCLKFSCAANKEFCKSWKQKIAKRSSNDLKCVVLLRPKGEWAIKTFVFFKDLS